MAIVRFVVAFAKRSLRRSIVLSSWLAVVLACSGTKAMCHDHGALSHAVSRSSIFEDHLRNFHSIAAPVETINLGLHFHWQIAGDRGQSNDPLANGVSSVSIVHGFDNDSAPRVLVDADLQLAHGQLYVRAADVLWPVQSSPSFVRLSGYVNPDHFLGNMRC